MVVQRFIKFVLFAGTFYLAKELGVWEDPVEPDVNMEKEGSVETESSTEQPAERKSPDFKKAFFDEEDKRKLQRKKEELEKKLCPKGSICEPPPKSLSESIGEALYDTWLALKKIPPYWMEAAENVAESICRLIKGDK
ncbi:uncharacterized protein LOC108093798 [Drosophila ficusphila]|uniref:uncharacterized protein LOC108093798 n=1 Tax=Drosophila ficusphila TaxID=30025 RepID=UPI0007E5BDB0|nr:uncharacterized protein LOC108093798 [Drosophila ficusphila]